MVLMVSQDNSLWWNVECGVSTVTLVVVKKPNGLNAVNGRMKSRQDAKLIHHIRLEGITK